jgi:hypothetical protein
MDYKEKIIQAIEKAHQNLALDRKIRDEAIAKCRKREQEEEERIKLLLKQYFDEELRDCNGNSVREGYIIATQDHRLAYKVIKRGMQFLFGEPRFNPSIEVVKYSVLKEPREGKKIMSIYKRDLKNMVIMFDDSELTNKEK